MNEKKLNKSKIYAIIVTILLIANIAITSILLGLHINSNKKNHDEKTKYTLYIGTNDKDTYKPVYELEVCRTKVTEICTKYTGGCTVYDAAGYWKDDTDAITKENTLVCILEDIEKETVYKICDDIIVELNQNSILVETNNVTSIFYSTKKN